MIVVDRLEADRAILEVDGELCEFPRTALPPTAREGDVLSLVPDAAHTTQARESAQAMMERLAARHSLPDDITL